MQTRFVGLACADLACVWQAVRENLAVLMPVLGQAVHQASLPVPPAPTIAAPPTAFGRGFSAGGGGAADNKHTSDVTSPSRVKPMSGWRPELASAGLSPGATRPWASSEQPPARHLTRAERP